MWVCACARDIQYQSSIQGVYRNHAHLDLLGSCDVLLHTKGVSHMMVTWHYLKAIGSLCMATFLCKFKFVNFILNFPPFPAP